MFRNQYDGDVIFWSPQGRIHQIEYAEEAVKQGSATVGLKSKTHAVLVALKRAPSDLSVNQKKILPIDTHVGISIAGLTADARLLSHYMRSECLSNLYNYEEPLAVSRLVAMVGSKSQIRTQRAGGRPFGVGLLVAGYDKKGAHLYQTCPSANYFDCQAMAIGARSQSARTYLERHLEKFENCTLEELVRHGLLALRDTLPNEVDLTIKNCSVGLVGIDTAFTTYEDDHIDQHLKLIEGVARSPGAGKDDDPTPMDEDSDNGGGPGPGPGPGGPGGSGSPPPSDNGMD